MTAPVTVTRLNVTSDRCYKGLHYIEGAPFRISFWTLATDIDPAEGVRRLRFADDLVAAWNTRQQAASTSNAQIAELREALALAEDALRNHACSGFGIPCRRSTEQCRTDCGQMAGEALDAVILARAKSASEAGGV